MPLSPDTLFERRWMIEGKNRRGGSSTVHKGVDTISHQEVAIKVLECAEGADRGRLKDFWTRETKSLADIKHPNIVSLLDAGYSEEFKSFFLVFPWHERSLKGEMELNRYPPDWHSYFSTIARPLLSAIALLHERGVVHRDIKPSNILLNDDGAPLLADFGISKIKRELLSGTTLSNYGSEPWCPPERDSGAIPATRDIFGFGALTASMLCKEIPQNYQHLEEMTKRVATKEFGSPSLMDMLSLCCNREPAKRPESAQKILAAIAKEDEKYLATASGRKAHGFRISARFVEVAIAENDEFRDAGDVAKMIENDLGDSPHIERDENTREPSRPLIGLIGHRNIYLANVDNDAGSHLQIFATKLRNMLPHIYEQHRADGFNPRAIFRFKPIILAPERHIRARELADMRSGLDDHEENRAEARRRANKKKLLLTWQHILEAQQSLLDAPIPFERNPDNLSDGIRLKIAQINGEKPPMRLSEAAIGTFRTVRPTQDDVLVQVEITEIDGEDIICRIVSGSDEDIPHAGRLVSDTFAQEAALSRQRIALDRVRSGSSARSDLADLLADPKIAHRPHDCGQLSFSNPDLDDDKKECVRKAMTAKDFLHVQGPPGTGKTTFIRELVHQILLADPNSRILLSSQTNVALDHALEGIVKLDELASKPDRIVRIFSKYRKLQGGTSSIRSLEDTVEAWKEKTAERSRSNITNLLVESGITGQDAERIMIIRISLGECRQAMDRERQSRAAAEKVRATIPEWKEDVPISELKDHERFEDVQEDYTEYRDLLKEAKEVRRAAFDRAKSTGVNGAKDIAELSSLLQMQLTAYLEKSAQSERLVRLLDLWDQWNQRLSRSDEFGKEVLAQASIVAATCVGLLGVADVRELAFDVVIVDEASKANPTEVLIPMTFGRKWILVGDDKQLPPYVGDLRDDQDTLEKFFLTKQDLEATIFTHLGNTLHADSRVTLSTQHRMVRPIGDLISNCFYDGLLRSRREWDKADRPYSGLWDPVTWIDTSSKVNNAESRGDGSSYFNNCEISTTTDLLREIDKRCASCQSKPSVLILAGYSAQVFRIADLVGTLRKHLVNITVEVNTIDSAQGRESDICIFSCVRSNPGLKYGFLREIRRINVALSRARDLLLIVGNAEFHDKTDAGNPLRSVLQHIEGAESGCKILTS